LMRIMKEAETSQGITKEAETIQDIEVDDSQGIKVDDSEEHRLKSQFKLSDLLHPENHDKGFVESFLFYHGMLTLKIPRQSSTMIVPNEHMRTMLVEVLFPKVKFNYNFAKPFFDRPSVESLQNALNLLRDQTYMPESNSFYISQMKHKESSIQLLLVAYFNGANKFFNDRLFDYIQCQVHVDKSSDAKKDKGFVDMLIVRKNDEYIIIELKIMTVEKNLEIVKQKALDQVNKYNYIPKADPKQSKSWRVLRFTCTVERKDKDSCEFHIEQGATTEGVTPPYVSPTKKIRNYKQKKNKLENNANRKSKTIFCILPNALHLLLKK